MDTYLAAATHGCFAGGDQVNSIVLTGKTPVRPSGLAETAGCGVESLANV